ncbi:hypothetical protein PR202_ga19143 [Eleusine coracana subsp. coracana]|uniref:Uncharacterized protein n=1 Tax=Eleusine coracana subsp. coracana TaxID=191504 RepID=A0AAV5CVA8_ELECO|nr:hypothetical protein PR202_ga19143 [Eleusine coracana subsp. coracana]
MEARRQLWQFAAALVFFHASEYVLAATFHGHCNVTATCYNIYRVSEDHFVSESDQLESHQAESPIVRIKGHHCACPGIPVFDTTTSALTVCPNTHTRGDLGQKAAVFASIGDRFITGYIVHPDGRTVFMSVAGYNPNMGLRSVYSYHPPNRCSTYVFDIESLDWTYIGEWTLPFTDQRHYDRELDAWFGICQYKRNRVAGCVCCCDVPPDAESRDATPNWKLCVDVLFEPNDSHFGSKLVYAGDSKFCLVEARVQVTLDDNDDDDDGFFHEVKMTSFVLKYDKVGDLRTTRHRGYASMYVIPVSQRK